MDKLREILEELVAFSTHEKDCIHCKQVIAQALSAIKAELLGKLPQEKTITPENIATIKDSNIQIAMKVAQELQRRIGFNSCLAKIKQIISEV